MVNIWDSQVLKDASRGVVDRESTLKGGSFGGWEFIAYPESSGHSGRTLLKIRCV